ncbi:MAG: RHS repeat-associated core domain-containing protein [Sporichthyaceae bacterium]
MRAIRSSRRRLLVAGTALALSAALVGQIAANANGGGVAGGVGDSDPKRRSAPDVPAPTSVDGTPLKLRGVATHPIEIAPDAEVVWPGTGRASAKVPTAKGGFVALGDTGFSVGSPESKAAKAIGGDLADGESVPDAVVIDPADQSVSRALDLAGLVAEVSTGGRDMPGPVALRLDYTDIADAYGGDWASRLQFVRLPDCALTTPELDECRVGAAIASHNDPTTGTVTAVVDLAEIEPTPSLAPTPSTNPSPASTPAANATSSPAPSARPTEAARASRELTNSSGAVVGITAATSGAGGDWSATPLSESSTWAAGGSSGAASWSYPLSVPDVPGGLVPNLAISYNSGSVDGRTGGRNNQSSWIGEGFDLAPGYIERRYVACADDTAADQDLTGTLGQAANNTGHKSADLCWRTDNAVLSLGGSVDELVRDKDAQSKWRKRFDDGTRVERLSDTEGPTNGAAGGEYWRITTPDGTRFFFGRGDVNGHDTASAWTVPVFGNHPDEPGYEISFEDSAVVNTAWRWNLDHVVDVHDNAVVYTWAPEENRYSPHTDPTATSLKYDRGGTLASIHYGLRANQTPTSASARVEFAVAERCTTGTAECAEGEIAAHGGRWPDVPKDLICNETTCGDDFAPTFFSRKRLTTITTAVKAASGWTSVTRWNIDQDFVVRNSGDTASKALWPNSIVQTGLVDGEISLPAVRLFPVWLQNRVDSTSDNIAAIHRPRLAEVINGSAGMTAFTYAPAQCAVGNVPSSRDDNTMRCFPVRYQQPGSNNPPVWNWFHKYVVAKVARHDLATTGEIVTTTYAYGGAPAWAYDDSVLSRKKDRTWNQWRGYETVTTSVGSGWEPEQGEPATNLKTVATYYRGLYGTKDDDVAGSDPDDAPNADAVIGVDPDDLAPNSRTDTVPSRATSGPQAGTAAADPAVKDYARFAGMTRQTITYDGTSEVSVVVTDPWQGSATAIAANADGAARARLAGVKATHTFTKLTALPGETGVTTWRHTQVRNTERDSYGYVVETVDEGDGVPAVCTRTDYNDRTATSRILDRVASTFSWSGACETGTLLGASKNYYDDDTDASQHGDPVGRGLLKRTSAAKGQAGSETWGTTSTVDYDQWGRPTLAIDALDRATTTTHRHTAQGRLDRVVVVAPDPDGTGPIVVDTVTDLDPVLGVPTRQESPSGAVATADYDALGRLVAVRSDGRANASIPDVAYAYQISGVVWDATNNKWKAQYPNAVVTSTWLNDGANEQTKQDGSKTKDRIVRSVALYDGLLRPRQTQTELLADDQHPDGGRLVTLTEYDSRGLVVAAHGPAFNDDQVGTTTADFLKFAIGDPAPGTTRTDYDGAGRPTTSTFTAFTPAEEDQPQQTLALPTSYFYGGYWTKVVPPGAQPPAGQPATEPARTTVLDARGRTTRLIEHGDAATGDRTTDYTWTPLGQPETMTDGAGNAWSWKWDLRGNRTEVVDPDAGTTRTLYDAVGLPTTAFTEAINDGQKWALVTTYDVLGRRTKLEQATANTAGTAVEGPKQTLSEWTYDQVKNAQGQVVQTVPGLPASSTRVLYNAQGASTNLVTAVAGYGDGDRPTGSTTTVKALAGVLEPELLGVSNYDTAATDSTAFEYNPDGSPKHTDLAAFGPIKGERLRHGYDPNGRPEYLTGAGSYVADTLRAPTGEALRYGLGNTWSKAIWLRQAYQPGTRRLTDTWIDRESVATTDVHTAWTYDRAGNPERATTWRNLTSETLETPGTAEETQCFAYDGLRQLRAAWTPAYSPTGETCVAAEAGTTALGGPAPYSQQWTFDTHNANRSTETTRSGGGTSGLPVRTTSAVYDYLDGDNSHQLQSVRTSINGAPEVTDGYTFDAAGNTVSRSIASTGPANQTLTWTPEGKLAKVQDGSTVVEENHYDVDGSRVARRDATGTTLYLGDTEITRNRDTGATSWRRHYSFDGRTIAVRDGNAMADVQFHIVDPHNTGTWALEAASDTNGFLHRRTTPYGAERGTNSPTWAATRGFVDGTPNPATGLVHIGARQYEPITGRFVSPDPLLDLSDPVQHHAYGYSANNPVAFADPSGMLYCDACNGGSGRYETTPVGHPNRGPGMDLPLVGGLSENNAERPVHQPQADNRRNADPKKDNHGGLGGWFKDRGSDVRGAVNGTLHAGKSAAGDAKNLAVSTYDRVTAGTQGFCIGGDFNGGVGFGVSGCVTLTNGRDLGSSATVRTGGGSPSVGVHVGRLRSNAQDPSDLAGGGGYLGGSVVLGPGIGPTVGGEGSIAKSSDGRTIWSVTEDVGVGIVIPFPVPIPAEGHAGTSWTWTWG